jgi:hypothetical protein
LGKEVPMRFADAAEVVERSAGWSRFGGTI